MLYNTSKSKIVGARRIYFIDMECLPNWDLHNFLNQRKPILTEELLLPWTKNISSALAHLHDIVRLVHFDLKPNNILVAADFSLKIADIGFARNPLNMEDYCGYTGYFAPEQLDRSLSPLGYKVDIFSLGVMLYEITNARHPFWESARFGSMDAHQISQALISNVRNHDMSKFNPIFPLNIDFIGLIEKMVLFDPSSRPTAGNILNLQIILETSSIPPSVGFRQQINPSPSQVMP